jgi:hypothetical protein
MTLTREQIEDLRPAVVQLLREAGRKYPCLDDDEFIAQVNDALDMALSSLSRELEGVRKALAEATPFISEFSGAGNTKAWRWLKKHKSAIDSALRE